MKAMITEKTLIENGFIAKTINRHNYFEKGDIIVFYNDFNWHIGHIQNGDIYAVPNVNGFVCFSGLKQILEEAGKSL